MSHVHVRSLRQHVVLITNRRRDSILPPSAVDWNRYSSPAPTRREVTSHSDKKFSLSPSVHQDVFTQITLQPEACTVQTEEPLAVVDTLASVLPSSWVSGPWLNTPLCFEMVGI